MEYRIPPCYIVQILTRWLPAEKIFLGIFSTTFWIQPPVSTASSLHPDPRLGPQGLDLLKRSNLS